MVLRFVVFVQISRLVMAMPTAKLRQSPCCEQFRLSNLDVTRNMIVSVWKLILKNHD